MKVHITALIAGTAIVLAPCASAQQEEPDTFPLDVLPAADPAELNRLAALPDQLLIDALFRDAPPGRSPVLERYSPSGAPGFPVSHGYAGPRDACLRYRAPAACRLHLEDLTTIQLRMRPGGATGNPFGVNR